jgi:hypothetical protein
VREVVEEAHFDTKSVFLAPRRGTRDDSFQVSTQYAHILIDTEPNAAET